MLSIQLRSQNPHRQECLCYLLLASVADYAAGLYVEADFPDRQARLAAEGRDEAQETPDVTKIRRQADRRADGARALVAALLHQADEAMQIDVGAQAESGAHVLFGQAFGNFSRARIAEAA